MNANPSSEELRVWAYDPEVRLMEQDEDVILQSPEYIHILMELATEAACPKLKYVRSILAAYVTASLGFKRMYELGEIAEKIHSYSGPHDEWLRTWKKDFKEVWNRLNHPGKMKYREARDLAEYLVAGEENVLVLRPGRKFDDHRHEFFGEYGTFRHYIYINLKTGTWKTSRGRQQKNCPV